MSTLEPLENSAPRGKRHCSLFVLAIEDTIELRNSFDAPFPIVGLECGVGIAQKPILCAPVGAAFGRKFRAVQHSSLTHV